MNDGAFCRRTFETGMMRKTLPFLMAALLAGPAQAQTSAQMQMPALEKNRALCADDTVTDGVAIAACNAVLRSGHETLDTRAMAHKNLCLVLNNRGEHDLAIQNCDAAITLKPDDVQAFLFRGHAYFNKGDYDRAIWEFDQAMILGPETADGLVERAAAYHRKGDEADAIADLDRAIALKPGDPTAFFIRGAAYQELADNESAIRDYGEAIRLAPNFAGALYRLGVLKLKLGDTRGGTDAIARARKINPGVGK
jgi:tetratricopeptide (TPR) repeat protein